jgi:hypothetical protein
MQEEQKTIVRTLYFFSWAALTGSSFILLSSFVSKTSISSTISSLVGVISCLFVLWLLGRKQFIVPRIIVPLVIYALATYLISTGDSVGVHDEAMLLYPLTIACAGLLLGRVGIIISAILVVFTTSGAAYGELQGWFVNRLSDATTPTTMVVVGVLNSLTAAMMYILVNSYSAGLERARNNEKRLEEANHELQSVRASLEDRVTERTHSAEVARHEAETARKAVETEAWLTAGQVQLNDVLRGEQNVPALAAGAMCQICQYLNIPVGALFLLQGEILTRVGGYALENQAPSQFRLGEGLVGQAAVEKRAISLQMVPPQALKVSSTLGKMLPHEVRIQPVLNGTHLIDVIELGLLEPLRDEQIQFLQRIEDSIAIAFQTARARQRANELLAETQRQAEELQAQEEELRSINEELQSQSERLTK